MLKLVLGLMVIIASLMVVATASADGSTTISPIGLAELQDGKHRITIMTQPVLISAQPAPGEVGRPYFRGVRKQAGLTLAGYSCHCDQELRYFWPKASNHTAPNTIIIRYQDFKQQY